MDNRYKVIVNRYGYLIWDCIERKIVDSFTESGYKKYCERLRKEMIK